LTNYGKKIQYEHKHKFGQKLEQFLYAKGEGIMVSKNEMVIFETADKQVSLPVTVEHETV